MDTFESEDQQVVALKTFWQSYGKPVITGIAIGAIALGGWNYYNNHKQQQNMVNGIAYQQVVQNLRMNHDKAFGMAEKFAGENQGNVFGALADLQLADEAVAANRLDLAAKSLQSIVDHPSDDTLKPIAATRLARVLVAQNKADAALKVLDAVQDKAYKASVSELRGDIYLVQKQTDKARAAYQDAVADSKGNVSPVLQMKLDDISSK